MSSADDAADAVRGLGISDAPQPTQQPAVLPLQRRPHTAVSASVRGSTTSADIERTSSIHSANSLSSQTSASFAWRPHPQSLPMQQQALPPPFPFSVPPPNYRPPIQRFASPPPGFVPPPSQRLPAPDSMSPPPTSTSSPNLHPQQQVPMRPPFVPGNPPAFMRLPPPNGQWMPQPGMPAPPPGMPALPPGMMLPQGMAGLPPMLSGPPPPWMMTAPIPGAPGPPPQFPVSGALRIEPADMLATQNFEDIHSDSGSDIGDRRVSVASSNGGGSEAGSTSETNRTMPPPMFNGQPIPMPMMISQYGGFGGPIRPPGPPGSVPPPPPQFLSNNMPIAPNNGIAMQIPPGQLNMLPSGAPMSAQIPGPPPPPPSNGGLSIAPGLVRTDSDNSSIRSTNTTATASGRHRQNITTLPNGESLEMYRQNAKKSGDPGVQLDFAKFLIATADTVMDSDPDPKRAKKTQDSLYAEALKWIKKLSKSESGRGGAYPEAMFYLAECYGNGSIGLHVDHDRAFTLYVQASKQNHAAAAYRAAVCYEVGAGTKKDYARSVQFYRKSAALGDTAAMYKLGMILLNGLLNQPKNPREGITWLKRAGSQADETTPHALHELAQLYEGKGETNGLVIPDPAYAHDLYRRGAQLGYSPSQYKLGVCYEYGLLDLPIDPRRSIAWYTRSAEQGDPEAELALSGWYLTGADGVLKQSDTEAYLWARKAADKGLAKAEYAVGYYSEHGVGVKSDVEEARKWYMRAAAQNNKRAVQRLKELKGFSGAAQEKGRSGNWRKDGANANDKDCTIM
ncbi:hypothetical protein HDU84_007770 [Entophlyctis sp. JEL0112]|nr:hypothetical protein HDU84_007770 [Entophlyctis sp. JEL0112]